MPAPDTTLVLATGTTPATVAALAVAAGYTLRDSADLDGDGVLDRAAWGSDNGTLTYARDMATGLQTVVIAGAMPQSWPAALPLIGEAAIEDLLRSEAEASILAGLQAAAITGAKRLAPLVAAATAALDPALGDYVLNFAAALPEAARRGPVAARFPASGGRPEKLQILRWIGASTDSADLIPIVGGGLLDDDWEVRVTAMLAAARIGASALAPEVARLALPSDDADGVTRREASALLALRDAVLARLGKPRDRFLPPGIAAAIDGRFDALPADLRPLFRALMTPLPTAFARPAVPGIIWTETGPQFENGRLLAFVPPLPHWLGDAALTSGPANPPRVETPANGFFVDAEAVGTGTLADARTAAAAAGAALPTSEQWEMAARGPDGRRFPSGLNARALVDLSPWGMTGLVQGPGEWLAGPAPPGMGLIGGGRRLPVIARRAVVPETQLKLFRFAYPAV